MAVSPKFPNEGEGGKGSAVWEFSPHNPVFISEGAPNSTSIALIGIDVRPETAKKTAPPMGRVRPYHMWPIAEGS